MIVIHVRHIETKCYAGIFWADTHADLWWLVDQLGDPADYEWCRAKHGGVEVAEEMTTTSFEWSGDEEDDGAFRAFKVCFDEYSSNDFRKAKWKPFDLATEGNGGIAQLMVRNR